MYTVTLNLSDGNGNDYLRYKTITIKEQAPQILGPFSFQGIEGQTVSLDVEVYDALLDEPSLKFEWYNENYILISTDRKPTIVHDEGTYTYILNVTDSSGFSSTSEIVVTVHPISPQIFVPDFRYFGPPGTPSSTKTTGKLILRAYSIDYGADLSDLKFEWCIKSGRDSYFRPDRVINNCSEISFTCIENTVYQGWVTVSDPSGATQVATFEIFSILHEEEAEEEPYRPDIPYIVGLMPASPQDSEDDDNDGLSNSYELTISGTNPYDADHDNDGLLDGFNASGIGELTLGTSPTNPDTDSDQITDFIEYTGWTIEIAYFENTSLLRVSSDPLDANTDDDGLTDNEEYVAGTHPRLRDSENDGLEDHEDPYPTSFDHDEDMLSDFKELQIGTNMSMSDTDGDTIPDGEELLYYRTSPLYKDSDFDFAPDNAELINYHIKIEDEYGKDIRLNLSNPVFLHFPEFFTTAAVAHIRFAISFGEQGSDEIQAYGIAENNVSNLTITISKPNENVVLYNETLNSSRYISQVVDVSEIMNDRELGFNYYGEYVIEARSAEGGNIPGCLLEQFELDFSRALDPNNEDVDKDGLLDGLEMNLLARGIKKIDIKDKYNYSSEGKEYNGKNGTRNELSLEIPSIGRVYDANLTIGIHSGTPLTGQGNISVALYQKNVNLTKENRLLMEYYRTFSADNSIFFAQTLSLSTLLESGTIEEYYGNYILTIEIHSSHNNDTFYVSEYYITLDTYVPAGPQDTKAWITSPLLEDSDGDGWNDKYEIFNKGTNPLSKDTDGDSAIDSRDRDPLKNIMLEIRPIRATISYPLINPTLEIAMKFNVHDIIDPDFSDESSTIGMCTTSRQIETDISNFPGLQTAWWNNGEGTHYYFDISDDKL
jgi:hypothetical protein